MKHWKKGSWPWSRDLLFKFRDPLISLERRKLQTSNFPCKFMWYWTRKRKNRSKAGVS